MSAQTCQVAAASTKREMKSSSESISHRHLQRSLAWPPRSPELTPLDFFVCGYMKALIYMSPIDLEEAVIARIAEAAATIRQQPGIFGVHVNLFCVVAGCVSRSVAVRLNIGLCSKLTRNTTFLFRILQ